MRANPVWGSLLSALAVGACDPIEVGRLDGPPREYLPASDAQVDLLDAGEMASDAGVADGGLKPSMSVDRDASRSDAARPDAGASTDAGSDAGNPNTDAGGTMPPTDAGSDAGSTGTGGDAGHDAGMTASCEGRSLFGLCWYLGASGASCNAECASHGGYDVRATSSVGTESQGGSYEECEDLLDLLGRAGRVGEGKRDDDNGFGCHVWTDGDLWWLNTPQFRPSVSAPGVRIVCGCMR
jgi:hypothetical protein